MKCPYCNGRRLYCFFEKIAVPVIDAPEYEPVTIKVIVKR